MTDTAKADAGKAEAPAPEPPKKTTVTITVDGKAHEARPGQLVIDAAEDAGVYVPRFCYHPRMTPVGMCRQCLVEVEGPRGPMMVVSCMTPVAENQVVHTDSPTVKKAQEGVLEFLLANHPLDCPVCDKGGECPLQDQAFSHGPGESRFVEEKRHYEKPIAISDLVFLDRERCILCDRCTRFAKEVAGDPLIHFTFRGNDTQINTFPDDPFSSYFSGNTVQICPVGALTAKPYRFKARPWDLEQTESTCTTCSVGCRTVVQSTRDELVRYQGVDSDPVNWGWLCDKGRFGFESVSSPDRLRLPLVKRGEAHQQVAWNVALDAAAAALRAAIEDGGAGSVAIIGGARGTNEDAYAWATLARGIGTPHTDAQLGDGLPADVLLGLPRATIDEAMKATTLVVLAPDLKEELPVLFLRVKDAADKRKTRVLEVSARDTSVSALAYRTVHYRPGEQANVVRQLVVDESEQLGKGNVVAIVGRANLAESAQPTLDAIAALQTAVPGIRFLPVARRGNVLGALAAGLRPRTGESGMDATAICEAAAAGKIGCLVLLGADPLADLPDRSLARRALAGAGSIIAVDTFLTESAAHADVVLAAATTGERAGTTTNLEGRVTRLSQKVSAGLARPDWMIAVELAERLGHDLGFTALDGVTHELAVTVDAFAPVTADALATHRDGVLLDLGHGHEVAPSAAAAPSGSSYDFRLVAARKLYDAGQLVRRSPSLAHLAPGGLLHLHPHDADRLGAGDGKQVKVTSTRTSLTMTVAHDESLPRGVAFVPFNQPDGTVAELIDSAAPVTDLKVESL